MIEQIISWDIYEITNEKTSLLGIKLRGSLRKFSLDNAFNLLTENAYDKDNCVRFAVLAGMNTNSIYKFLQTLISGSQVSLILSGINNPVLSKLKVNDVVRY